MANETKIDPVVQLLHKCKVLDIETQHCIDFERPYWREHLQELGIASMVLGHPFPSAEQMVYEDFIAMNRVNELLKSLMRCTILVGWNLIKFDLPLLSAVLCAHQDELGYTLYNHLFDIKKCPWTWKLPVIDLKLDLMDALKEGLDDTTHHRTSLKDSAVPFTYYEMKGAMAPALYQNNNLLDLLRYNRQDVYATGMILEHALRHGQIMWQGDWVDVTVHLRHPVTGDIVETEEECLLMKHK